MSGAVKRAARGVWDLFGSYGFAVILLLFLFLLTALGTLAQRYDSLYEVQRRYFESVIVLDETFGFPLPLPGVYLLLALLAGNLVVGGFIRIRKAKATVGVLIIHAGILLMLVAGLVEYYGSTKGRMTLYEGQRSNEYVSYYEWEIAVGEVGGRDELVIPGERFIELDSDAIASFESERLPFDIAVGTVSKNCRPVPAAQRQPGDGAVVEGFCLRPLPREKEAEFDAAGLYVSLTDKRTGARKDAILFSLQRAPMTVQFGGKRYYLELTHKRWQVPFEIELVDFRRELHPRSGEMAKAFESDVFKREGGVEEKVTISMNQPLRRHGYTFFQSNWGPQNAGPGTPLYSGFSVVKNPADQWPLYACIVIAAGMLLHFTRKLVKHVRSQRRARS